MARTNHDGGWRDMLERQLMEMVLPMLSTEALDVLVDELARQLYGGPLPLPPTRPAHHLRLVTSRDSENA